MRGGAPTACGTTLLGRERLGVASLVLAPGLEGVADALPGPAVGVLSFAWLFGQTLLLGWSCPFSLCGGRFFLCRLVAPLGRRLVGPRASVESD